MRLFHAVVRAAVDRDVSLTCRCFGRVHLAGSFKCARDLDTEVAPYWRARLSRVVVEKMLWPLVHRPGWLRMKARSCPRRVPKPRPPRPAGPRAAPRPTCEGELLVR